MQTRFRERVKAERERDRRKWSQAELSKRLQAKGLKHILPSTVAKIESGDRAVRIDEANALADLFGVSVDGLLGRNPAGGELALVASNLTELARKSAGRHIGDLIDNIASELTELRYCAAEAVDSELTEVRHPPGGSVEELIASTETVLSALGEAQRALAALGDMPVPSVAITMRKRQAHE